MLWTIDYTESARNRLKRVDKPVAKRILDFMDNRVAKQEDPRTIGKALTGPLGSLWRYRVGDYRIVREIQHLTVRILIIRIGHRREVYC